MSNAGGNCLLKKKKKQKNVQKGIAGPTYLLSPSPKPNLKIYCLLGEKLSPLKCKPQNLQQLISPCKTMKKAVCPISMLAGSGWVWGVTYQSSQLLEFLSQQFQKDLPSLYWPGKPWKSSIMKEKGLFRDGSCARKNLWHESGWLQGIESGAIIPGIAEIWSLLSLCIFVYRSWWLTDRISCLGEKHNKIKPWQGMSL